MFLLMVDFLTMLPTRFAFLTVVDSWVRRGTRISFFLSLRNEVHEDQCKYNEVTFCFDYLISLGNISLGLFKSSLLSIRA